MRAERQLGRCRLPFEHIAPQGESSPDSTEKERERSMTRSEIVMKKRVLKGIGIIAGLAVMSFLGGCDRHAEARNVPDVSPDAKDMAPEAGTQAGDAVQMPSSEGDVMVIYGPVEGDPAYDGEAPLGNVSPDDMRYEDGVMAIYGPAEMPDAEKSEADSADEAKEEIRELQKLPEHEMIQALYGVQEPEFRR